MSAVVDRNFVTEYANSGGWESIAAVFKLLYSDFIVIEIPEEGRPLQPVADDVIPEEVDTVVFDEQKLEKSGTSDVIPAALGTDFAERVEKLINSGEGDGEKTIAINTEGLSKEERRGIHEYIRVHYGGQLCSTAENNSLTIRPISGNSGTDSRAKRPIWPADRPDYLHFTVTKENRDCQWAVALLSRLCHLRPQNFSMAGTKDRRAVTSQRMCVYRVERSRMQGVAKNRLRHGVWLSNFDYRPEKLSLGALWGNRFHVVLRGIDEEKLREREKLAHRIDEWQRTGFLNYFGAQRFGTCGVKTADVGRLILSSRWKEAVGELLKPRTESHGRLGDALKHFAEHNDASAALKLLSYSGGDSQRRQQPQLIESALLTALKRDKNAYKSALLTLPRDARSLYVHAYQSCLFNRAVSERVVEHGLRVLEGDLGASGEKLTPTDSKGLDEVYTPLPSAKSFTMDDDASRRYKRLMEEDGVDPSAFSALERQFSIGEVVRPMLIKPREVHWEVVNYGDPREVLQHSPFTPPPPPPSSTATTNEGAASAKNESGAAQQPYWALKIQFDLPSGCYATVALRELLRWEMDKEAQKGAQSGAKPAEVAC